MEGQQIIVKKDITKGLIALGFKEINKVFFEKKELSLQLICIDDGELGNGFQVYRRNVLLGTEYISEPLDLARIETYLAESKIKEFLNFISINI